MFVPGGLDGKPGRRISPPNRQAVEKGILIYRHSDGSIEKIDSEWQTSRNQILAEIGQSEYSDRLLAEECLALFRLGGFGMQGRLNLLERTNQPVLGKPTA
jgi:hypothetical protein